MEIVFESEELAALANEERKARKDLGKDGAKKFQRRLDDLAAAPCLAEAYQLPGKFEALKGDRSGLYSLRLDGGRRVVLRPNQDPLPVRTDGSIDLTRITKICIVRVEDYHA